MKWITEKNGMDYAKDESGAIWVRGTGDIDTLIQYHKDLDGPIPESIIKQLKDQDGQGEQISTSVD